MDEVEIPRIHKPGHTLPHSLKPKGSSSLKSLIEHLKPVAAAKLKEDNTTTSTNQGTGIAQFPSSPSAEDGKILEVDDSMLGQPPSVYAVSPMPTRPGRDRRKKSNKDQDLEDMDVEQGLDMALRHMYREVQEENIEVCVLEERLDEKDIALMDGASVCVFFLAGESLLFYPFRYTFSTFLPSAFSQFRFLTLQSPGSATPSSAHRTLGAVSTAYKHEVPRTWRQDE